MTAEIWKGVKTKQTKTLTCFVAVVASQKQLLLLVTTFMFKKKSKTILQNCRQVVGVFFNGIGRMETWVSLAVVQHPLTCVGNGSVLLWPLFLEHFYIALLSAFEQTHRAYVAYFGYPPKWRADSTVWLLRGWCHVTLLLLSMDNEDHLFIAGRIIWTDAQASSTVLRAGHLVWRLDGFVRVFSVFLSFCISHCLYIGLFAVEECYCEVSAL